MRPIDILTVEDDPLFARDLAEELGRAVGDAAQLRAASCLEEALKALEPLPDLVLLDALFPLAPGGAKDEDGGSRFLEALEARACPVPVIVLSGQDKKRAVRLLVRHRNVADYLFKDAPWTEIRARLAAEVTRLGALHRASRAWLPAMVGGSLSWKAAVERVERAAPYDTTVLLTGESGTGKEMLARWLHARSRRCAGPLVAVNCAALPQDIAENELFGHQRGAFTGADEARPGRIAAASGGTLFLDEIGELPLAVQGKLLRVLEERAVLPLGATRPVPVDLRLVAATNRDLPRAVARGAFREDLYHRIAVLPVELPPLRERGDDVLRLADAFLADLSSAMGRPRPTLSEGARQRLRAYPFPGNVRELRNAVERALILHPGPNLGEAAFELGSPAPAGEGADLSPLLRLPFEAARETFEKSYIGAALARFGGNVSRTARETGIPRKTLQRRRKQYGLDGGPRPLGAGDDSGGHPDEA